MTHYRSGYRTLVAGAVAASPYFAGMTRLSAWVDGFNATSLPAWFVATPRERAARVSHGTSQRDTDLVVGIKRLGTDDIEDVLDADSAVVEQLVIAALRTQERDCETGEINIKVDGGGEQRVGTLTLTFRITGWLPDPALSLEGHEQ